MTPATQPSDRPDWEDDERPLERADVPQSHLDDDEYDEFVKQELEGEDLRPSPPSRTALVMIGLLVLAVAVLLALLTTATRK